MASSAAVGACVGPTSPSPVPVGEGRAEAVPRCRQQGPVEAQRLGDALLQHRAQVLARHEFDDPSQQVVAVVAVRPLRAGWRDRREQCFRGEQFVDGAAVNDLALDGRRREAVGEAARVVEELTDGDLVAVGHARHPLGDVVVERHLVLADELQDEVRGECLGLAGDLELHVGVERRAGRQIGDAASGDEVAFRAPDADEGTRGLIRVLELTDDLLDPCPCRTGQTIAAPRHSPVPTPPARPPRPGPKQRAPASGSSCCPEEDRARCVASSQ